VNCRHCETPLALDFLDLGSAPPSNALLTAESLLRPEKWYPLQVKVCTTCWLVQTIDYADRAELFAEDYVYFSSYSSSWVRHAARYVEAMVERFALTTRAMVVEVAANDGYLLQFVRERGIPCLGIEPTASTASAARARGIEIVESFLGRALGQRLAGEGGAADLIVANNVLAHVPDINDFVAGIAALLKPQGVVTFEFPHLAQLVAERQFDTVYHEHFSYLSALAVTRILERNGLQVFDLEALSTHGGSLRVFAQRTGSGRQPVQPSVADMLARERLLGLESSAFYVKFQTLANRIKNDCLAFLLEAHKAGKTVAAYGAAAKGNTLLNYAGVKPDLLSFVVDKNPQKQGRYLPGSRIPIGDPDWLRQRKPDYVAILPWNLRDEVAEEIAWVAEWGGRLVTFVPGLHVW